MLRIVGPLPPVLISRYAKNHSPDDFCLRHSTFYIMHSTLLLCILHCSAGFTELKSLYTARQSTKCSAIIWLLSPLAKLYKSKSAGLPTLCILHSTFCIVRYSALFCRFSGIKIHCIQQACQPSVLQLFATFSCNFL